MPKPIPRSLTAPLAEHAQYIVEQHYLRPFPSRASENKDNLYQLPVERISHGAQHAIRVALLVRVLANFLKQSQPELIKELDDATIRRLEIIALFHDAARENDREVDRWEKQSTDLCAQYLETIGDAQHARLAELIQQPETKGLLGNILQSADCLDIMRCKRTFDISRMRLWQAFNDKQKSAFLPLIEEHLECIAEQHDLKHDLKFSILGQSFSHKATRDASQPELKQAYEQADNAYLKMASELKEKPNLSGFYENRPNMIKPDNMDSSNNDKSELAAPVKKKKVKGFEPQPWLLASMIHPDKKPLINDVHYYGYTSRKAAEEQLERLKDLLGEQHPELKELARVSENKRFLDTPFRFLLSKDQEEALKKLQGHPRLVKSIRWDAACFFDEFILGITPSDKKRHRQELRRGNHRNYTVFPEGAYNYNEKPSPYPERKLPQKKAKRSQHQSTTLVSHKTPSPVFGHSKDRMAKLAGVILDADDALVNRYFIYDSGTVRRPYEHHTMDKAKAYHQKVVNSDKPLLFSNRNDFEQALQKQLDKHNEVLARIRWNVNSSAIGIFNDSFEARAVAHYYAEQTHLRVKEQYEENALTWDDNYQIPILYYLPSHKKNWTSYTKESIEEDKAKAKRIYENPEKRQARIKQNNGEFLLLLDNPREVWDSLLNDKDAPLLTMINQEQFQLIEALYQRTGYKEPLEEALSFKSIQHSQKQMITPKAFRKAAEKNKRYVLSLCTSLGLTEKLLNEANDDGATPLYTAAKNGHTETAKALLKVEGIEVNKPYRNYFGYTPLYIAAQNGHIEIVKALLEIEGVKVNKANTFGELPLHKAAQNGHIKVVKALVEAGSTNLKSPFIFSLQHHRIRDKTIILYLKQCMKHPDSKGNDYQLIQNALMDYAGGVKNKLQSNFQLFFTGHWNRHHGKLIRELFRSDDYREKKFDETLLKNFLNDLHQSIDPSEINERGDLANIFSLTKTLLGIDFYEIETPSDEPRKRNSGFVELP